jgi:hypothetical protein
VLQDGHRYRDALFDVAATCLCLEDAPGFRVSVLACGDLEVELLLVHNLVLNPVVDNKIARAAITVAWTWTQGFLIILTATCITNSAFIAESHTVVFTQK